MIGTETSLGRVTARMLSGSLIIALLLLSGCASAPERTSIVPQTAKAPVADSRLGVAAAGLVAKHQANVESGNAASATPATPAITDNRSATTAAPSAVYLLTEGTEAYAARLALVEAAEQTLDVQYYLFHQDDTGILLAGFLWKAAERGVRVRLLLDDLEDRPDDYPVSVLDSHPNIEVRLFNPYYRRSMRGLQMLTGFSRLNHRMHNKSFTADNVASIVGGRNVGDEYFDANQNVNFGDLDALLFGSAVEQVSQAFDAYWNSDLVYPLSLLKAKAVAPADKERVRGELLASLEVLQQNHYADTVTKEEVLQGLRDTSLAVIWAPVVVWADTPDLEVMKAKSDAEDLVINRLFELFGSAQQELVLVSPYFVPRNKGSAFLVAQAQSGVKVVVVTNSLSATDVVAVHSGYAKHRENLLAGGVEIFEVKATPDIKRKSWSLSSSSSLHAKTFVVDRRWVFVGSFNLDPRSAWLNTEMGVLIDSPALAQVMLQRLGENLGKVAYKLSLQEGELLWTDNASEQTYSAEPGSGWWRCFLAGFLSWMPIDSQL